MTQIMAILRPIRCRRCGGEFIPKLDASPHCAPCEAQPAAARAGQNDRWARVWREKMRAEQTA